MDCVKTWMRNWLSDDPLGELLQGLFYVVATVYVVAYAVVALK